MAQHEPMIRLAAFLGIFCAVGLWEALAPRRKRALKRHARWPHNIGLLFVDIVALRVVAPGAAIVVAYASEAGGWGLLNAVALPDLAAALVAVVLLDLAIYFQHVMFHAVPTLWRLHRVHHASPPRSSARLWRRSALP
jgi:sterol desaturase/sphingolipid hydroxylase (fatty acid hydroxylase superfamily)